MTASIDLCSRRSALARYIHTGPGSIYSRPSDVQRLPSCGHWARIRSLSRRVKRLRGCRHVERNPVTHSIVDEPAGESWPECIRRLAKEGNLDGPPMKIRRAETESRQGRTTPAILSTGDRCHSFTGTRRKFVKHLLFAGVAMPKEGGT